MKTIHKSVLIWYSAEEMFKLVTDVERYPEFLPWCDRASVSDVTDVGMMAKIGIAFGGVHQTFTTRNEHVPDREVHIHLVDGPFSRLDGDWKFTPLGGEGQRACKVELQMCYGFDHVTLATLIAPVFDKIAGSLVDAFVKRAEVVYG